MVPNKVVQERTVRARPTCLPGDNVPSFLRGSRRPGVRPWRKTCPRPWCNLPEDGNSNRGWASAESLPGTIFEPCGYPRHPVRLVFLREGLLLVARRIAAPIRQDPNLEKVDEFAARRIEFAVEHAR